MRHDRSDNGRELQRADCKSDYKCLGARATRFRRVEIRAIRDAGVVLLSFVVMFFKTELAAF